ncbi:hypothetical protein SAMN05192583_3341 [Sphingomonas gellani]|uniref:Uncharacterized protein n=1 Tax=Sphingomonas gellani TaxID=1166340 RepID=A0A1H8IML9_9SPHN|nr:hypothetical protein SAMN05192583_3341 [Sphingomonas gellani]
MALARFLPMTPVSATVIATLLAFAISAAAVMWAYATRSGWQALWTLLVAGTVAGMKPGARDAKKPLLRR